ncbi:hypothetical protein D9Q98_006207 [Chlorella vulgaris]|uniref:RCK N-terminal domain-containing protein n=1 Tax=Chlorella vulgaris TaxID=3077 RepID=A0A9D4TX79_CHLVU|nr:hypothetical protein D9Q98_006207 [Chlorella vulgaris]
MAGSLAARVGLAERRAAAAPLQWRPQRQHLRQRQWQGLVTHALASPQQALAPLHMKGGLAAPPQPHLSLGGRGSSSSHQAGRRSLVARNSGGFAPDPLVNLGNDFLTFLIATVLVVPVFKSAKQSPVLGYLFAGLVLGQLGLFRNLEEVEKLSELGVLFLLFEMGLELSIDRLRALASFAFGMGTLQMLICTVAFTVLGLPPGDAYFSQFLENVLHATPALAELRTVDEAIVIGAALSLSSSAFVLQLLRERGELDSRFGQATLGILLLQDIATVPFLVLLPLVEGSNAALLEGQDTISLVQQLGPTALKTLGGLGIVLLGGRLFMRRVFELVAEARSEETFIALVLLTVTGASLLTQRLGFSDTLGAFVAGVLLSETNFKTQVEADIQPFRGILLGLFFVTTGSSLDVGLLVQEWPLVLALLAGLLSLKITVISALGPLFGLTRAESVRTGFVLSQGGEFAFVLLALANQLEVLPAELNRLLIIVVVLSMALTPLLTEVGKQFGGKLGAGTGQAALLSSEGYNQQDPVIICGFGGVGQTVANMLESPALGRPLPYVAFDNNVGRVQAAQEAGFNVLFGDGTRKAVLQAAGIDKPRAIAVGYTARQKAVSAVEALHETYPGVPIYVRALDMQHAAMLRGAGATEVVVAEAEAGLVVGGHLARELGVPNRAILGLTSILRAEMSAFTSQLALSLAASSEAPSETAWIFKFDQGKAPAFTDDPISPDVPLMLDGNTPLGSSLLSSLISTLSSSGTVDEDEAARLLGSGQVQDDTKAGLYPPFSLTNDMVSMLDSRDMTESDDEQAVEGAAPVSDGSIDCPVPWDNMVSGDSDGEEAAKQQAASKRSSRG